MIRFNQRIRIDIDTAVIVEICDEPNTGWCVIHYKVFSFMIPCEFMEQLEQFNEVKNLVYRLEESQYRTQTASFGLLKEIKKVWEK